MVRIWKVAAVAAVLGLFGPGMATSLALAQSEYTETFEQDVVYESGSRQVDNWISFRRGIQTSGVESISLSGSLNQGGVVCDDPSSAQEIADNLRNFEPQDNSSTVQCGGQNWTVGNCFDEAELLVGQSTEVCYCNTSTYAVRPQVPAGDWGGLGGKTCKAPSQTMAVKIN
jgi:hypothetical protein